MTLSKKQQLKNKRTQTFEKAMQFFSTLQLGDLIIPNIEWLPYIGIVIELKINSFTVLYFGAQNSYYHKPHTLHVGVWYESLVKFKKLS